MKSLWLCKFVNSSDPSLPLVDALSETMLDRVRKEVVFNTTRSSTRPLGWGTSLILGGDAML